MPSDLGRPSWALAYSISLACTLTSPLAGQAARLFLISPLPPLLCSPSVRLGTPPFPPLVQTTSPSRSPSPIPSPLLTPPRPIEPSAIGPPLNRYTKSSQSPPHLLLLPGFPLRPGSTDTSPASLPFSSPILPPRPPLIAQNHGGLPSSPS